MEIPPMTEPFVDPEFIPGQIMRKNLYITGANEQFILNACHTFLPQGSQYRPTIEIMRNLRYADLYNEGLGVKFDHYDVFEKHKNKLGHFRIFGDPLKQEQQVINMFVQMFPQKPFFSFDSYNKRMKFFISNMNKVYRIKGLQSIAFPEKIACDLGSNWDKYLEILERFAKKHPNVRSVMYTGAFFSKFKIVEKVVKKLDPSVVDKETELASKTLKSIQRMMRTHDPRFDVKNLDK